MLGLARDSKTTENMVRSGECLLNLPSAHLVGAVDRLARTTGSNPVPAGKIKRGYRHERDKFDISGLTTLPGETVSAPRAAECPVQIEAKVAHVHKMAQVWHGNLVAIEVRVTRVPARPGIMMDGRPNRIDPDKWRPLIMSIQQFYGLTPQKLQRSELGQIPESAYKPQAGGPRLDFCVVFPDVQLHIGEAPLGAGPESRDSGFALRAPRNDVQRFPIISLAAIEPPPAISTAASAIVALGLAKPATIRNAVESSGVA